MRRPTVAVCVLAAATALLGIRPLAAEQTSSLDRERVDVSKKGPQIGERVPDFSLTDQNGRTRTLQSLMGERGLMLVFLRSADW
jgi:hypothetical protein